MSTGIKNCRRFKDKVNASLPWSGLPSVSTSKRLKEFCQALSPVGANACKEVKDAIDGQIPLAEAEQLRAKVAEVTEPEGVKPVIGIIKLEEELRKSYEANYPFFGNAELRRRAEGMVRKLVVLSYADNPEYAVVKEPFELIKKEIEFWSRAEKELLLTEMSKDEIIATRTMYLNAMMALECKQGHLNSIAGQYAAADRYIELANMSYTENIATSNGDTPAIENAAQLIDLYKENKTGTPGLPTDQEIANLVAFIDQEVATQGVANYIIDSPGYNSSTEAVMQQYKVWRQNWKQNELFKAQEKLVGWPEELVSEVSALKLSHVSAENKTKFIDAAQDVGGLARAWTLDAALTQANILADKHALTEREAEQIRDWTSKYLGKAIAIMEKEKGKSHSFS
jgi:hypothetical protein